MGRKGIQGEEIRGPSLLQHGKTTRLPNLTQQFDAWAAIPEPPEGTRGPDNGRTDAAGGLDPRRSTQRVLGEHGRQQAGTAGRRRHRAEIRRGEGPAPRAEGAVEGPDGIPGRGPTAGQRALTATAGAGTSEGALGGEPGRGHLSSCRPTTGRGTARPADAACSRARVPAARLPGGEPDRAFAARGTVSGLRYRRFGSDPAAPHPLLTPSGLQILVLNPWDQRPQTAATRFGTSGSERG